MHRARKRFGQNFLCDQSVIASIVNELNPKPKENLIEIGPGQGALTKGVLEKAQALRVIELDRDLIPGLNVLALTEEAKLDIIEQDVLTVDFSQFGEHQRVFGNLPYNISTPLLFHLLRFRELISDMHFMVQKEVADRIAAHPNTKEYGKLSVNLQAVFFIEKLFEVSPNAFNPAPKVTSAVIRLKPKPIETLSVPIESLIKLTTIAFSKRRKTLNNNFKGHFELSLLEEAGINGSRRAESLTLDEFIMLCDFIMKKDVSGYGI